MNKNTLINKKDEIFIIKNTDCETELFKNDDDNIISFFKLFKLSNDCDLQKNIIKNWIFSILRCAKEINYVSTLKGNSANAKFTEMIVKNDNITKQLFVKVQLDRYSDNMIIDNINGYLINRICDLYSHLNLQSNFMRYIESATGFYSENENKLFFEEKDNLYIPVKISLHETIPHKATLFYILSTLVSSTDGIIEKDILYDENLIKSINSKLVKLIKNMKFMGENYGMVHNDCHGSNIIYDNKQNFVVIDYGRVIFDNQMIFDNNNDLFENFIVKIKSELLKNYSYSGSQENIKYNELKLKICELLKYENDNIKNIVLNNDFDDYVRLTTQDYIPNFNFGCSKIQKIYMKFFSNYINPSIIRNDEYRHIVKHLNNINLSLDRFIKFYTTIRPYFYIFDLMSISMTYVYHIQKKLNKIKLFYEDINNQLDLNEYENTSKYKIYRYFEKFITFTFLGNSIENLTEKDIIISVLNLKDILGLLKDNYINNYDKPFVLGIAAFSLIMEFLKKKYKCGIDEFYIDSDLYLSAEMDFLTKTGYVYSKSFTFVNYEFKYPELIKFISYFYEKLPIIKDIINECFTTNSYKSLIGGKVKKIKYSPKYVISKFKKTNLKIKNITSKKFNYHMGGNFNNSSNNSSNDILDLIVGDTYAMDSKVNEKQLEIKNNTSNNTTNNTNNTNNIISCKINKNLELVKKELENKI